MERLKLPEYAVRADLVAFVDRAEDEPEHGISGGRPPGVLGRDQLLQQAVEDLAIVERDGKRGHAGRGQGVVDHLCGLRVGHRALGADGVEVALHELAEPPLRGPFAAEDRADRVPLEGDAQLVDVPGNKSGEGDGQVEPEGELPRLTPLVGHLEDLAEDLVGAGPLAGQDVHALDVRRLDRDVAERRERGAEGGQHPLARDHHRRGDVPQPAGHAGIDHGRRFLPDSIGRQ